MTEEGAPQATVVVVDDHAVFRDTLSLALGFEGFASLAIDPAAIALDDERVHGATVAVLDLDLGDCDLSGLDLVQAVAAGGTPVVVLTGNVDPAAQGACLEAGALDVCSKAAPLDEIIEVVRTVAKGSEPPGATKRAVLRAASVARRAHEGARFGPFDRLTPREADVLRELCAGRPAEAIARDAFVSIHTVRAQIRGVLVKLEVSSQLEAVCLAFRTGWAAGGSELTNLDDGRPRPAQDSDTSCRRARETATKGLAGC